MKSINFNRSSTVLRNLDESPTPKKKINWDKVIYFVVLFSIIFFVFRYFFIKTVYVSAPGHVLFKSLRIRVPEDINLDVFYIEEGDSIQVGDTLFSYYSYRDQQAVADQKVNIALPSSSGSSWYEKEIYSLKKSVSINNISVIEKKDLILWYQNEIEILKSEVILEITPKSKIESYAKEIQKLELEIKSLNNKNSAFNSLIAELQIKTQNKTQEASQVSAVNNGSGSGGASKKYYISPLKGTITRLYKNNYEVALKSEDILNMHEREDIYIKAFFNQEDLAYFDEGDKVYITFPNGEKSSGHIKRFYFATYKLPAEFQKKYESTTRAIAVDIFPIENESKIKWKAFYKMNVTVEINKFK